MLTKDGEVLPGTEIVTEEGDTAIVPNWKTPWNHNTVREAARTALVCLDPTKTQQHGREEADINVIVDRFLKTGLMPTVTVPPSYGDFSTADDYHALQNRIAETNALFYKLPAAIRASYQNDPGLWLEDVNTRIANNDLEPLREMGMDVPSGTPKAPTEGGTTPGAPAPEPPKTGADAPVT